MYTFNRVDSSHEDFKKLVLLLDEELAKRDGEEHAFYDQFNKIENINNVIVAYAGQQPVAAGAFKKFSPEAVEIKRMFVMPGFRRKGIAFQVLEQLENWAAGLGCSYCVLETGKKQPEAIALYKKSGYKVIPNYGQYKNVANSVCMRKEIS
ncbi:GNAT family N-acetyltransferase [Hanamia caeni]|uniref:GNAT family N-acetyltransferase n=2 Tax=Hanamia caeni TaxID=2294116 RepID=A0A3M9NL76_9BACT|nr:GNAT family N-acetyltransferase [Hanamia caeni]